MVKRKTVNEQNKLGIKSLDCNVLRDYISRFIMDFIDEVFPMLNIKEQKKRKEEIPFRLIQC